MKGAIATLLTSAILARADVITTSEPAQPQTTAEINTTKPESPVSDVKGLAFNRFYQVWLENVVSVDSRAFYWLGLLTCYQDYNTSAADSNLQWLASQGILLYVNNTYRYKLPVVYNTELTQDQLLCCHSPLGAQLLCSCWW